MKTIILLIQIFLFLTTTVYANENSVITSHMVGLDIIKSEKLAPPLAAFMISMANESANQAVTSFDQTQFTSLAYEAAFFKMLSLFIPSKKEFLDVHLKSKLKTTNEKAVRTKSEELAVNFYNKILPNLIAATNNELSTQQESRDGLWIKTPPSFQEPTLPQWGGNFHWIHSGVEKIIKGFQQPDVNSIKAQSELEEVYALGGTKSTVRTVDQTMIAHFWKGGPGTETPPGLWILIALNQAKQKKLTFKESATLFNILSKSLSDAGVFAWKLKYKTNCWRPVTAIQKLKDKTWEPTIATPPFPAYVSGHSTFSSAAATVLTNLLPLEKSETLIVESSDLPGTIREFKSYKAAALEAGISRIYGGIHFQLDNVDGLKLGRRIACNLIKKYTEKTSCK